MNKKLISILLVGVMLSSLLVVSGVVATSQEEKIPVIIMFKERPNTELIKQHHGEIKTVYHLKPALAASLPPKAVEHLKRNPNIEYIAKDLPIFTLDEVYDWGVNRIDADIVHANNNRGLGVNVAILDTGIDYEHPDLVANYKGGYDCANGDANPMDYDGHGTHCAGIVAAAMNNAGIIGVAPQANLYSLKVFTDEGNGNYNSVISALEWCIDTYSDDDPDNDIQVISMSFGSSYLSGDPGIEAWISDAYEAGIVLVGAAGNDGNWRGTRDNVIYPARYDDVIAVAATDTSDKRASFSSTGPDVELAAPGVNIYSTLPGGRYEAWSGTSMACPHVAGTAALVIASGITDENGDGKINAEIRLRLQTTADDFGAVGRDTKYGYGLVDAEEASPPGTTPPDTEPPAQVAGLIVTTVSSNQLDLSWTASTALDLDHYNVYRNITSGGPYDWVASSSTNSYSDTGLSASTTYYYKVAAVDTAGNKGELSVEASGTTSEAPAQSMHVQSIDMSTSTRKAGKNVFAWAIATVKIVDASNNPVEGATVSGQWSSATSDSDSGVTNAQGQVALTSDSVKKSGGVTFTFTVDNVVKEGWTYESTKNTETWDNIKLS